MEIIPGMYPVPTEANWDRLRLSRSQVAVLREISVAARAARSRWRAGTYDARDFAGKSSRGLGIGALFSGADAPGKVMAAKVLGGELSRALYRVDLSQVVSRYIGETENNLRRLFNAAEAAGAILFFDEADALFGKRSAVKDSHDRYADIEMNGLLRKMETYRGLTLVTARDEGAIDPSFLRRFRYILRFPSG